MLRSMAAENTFLNPSIKTADVRFGRYEIIKFGSKIGLIFLLSAYFSTWQFLLKD